MQFLLARWTNSEPLLLYALGTNTHTFVVLYSLDWMHCIAHSSLLTHTQVGYNIQHRIAGYFRIIMA